ncbi:TRAP-type C4-dicarboxylate transport system substrate-binding protein [Marinobacterium sp. MBR-111]|jgi:C4-dicarboxylate-binding protein DctP|uniref:TRAP transporter substrate-binding protein DctP n=1 Tax=Marinobacterium sp. MBR-111 TaxID=3156463 RepID=UPI0033979374
MKTTITTSLLSASVLFSGAAAATETIRCAHQFPPTHTIGQAIDKWAAEIETQSKGELKVEVYPANSLVSAKEVIPAVAKGDIECGFAINFSWGRTLPAMLVTTAPFAFSDVEVWKRWPTSEAAHFLERKLESKGLKNLTWMFQTNTSVFTTNGKFLNTPADFEGVKIRGVVPPFNAGLEKMGASPVSMSGGEVYQALSTGVIDAALTDIAAAVSRKYYEVQDHMTVFPIISVYAHGFANPRWYSKLSDENKQVLQAAGLKGAEWALELSEEAVADAPQQLRDKGVNLHYATAEEQQALSDVMLPAFNASFAKWAGDDTDELIKLIEKLH